MELIAFFARNPTRRLPPVNNCDLPGFKWGGRVGLFTTTGTVLV